MGTNKNYCLKLNGLRGVIRTRISAVEELHHLFKRFNGESSEKEPLTSRVVTKIVSVNVQRIKIILIDESLEP
ncbi:hypothetical protein DGWBC_0405 [Dehalogenimonas sp. WBC-2]|nr:hypothetical protein DGWBC_0405 [Dehalogenimonas sp. WBC-2]